MSLSQRPDSPADRARGFRPGLLLPLEVPLLPFSVPRSRVQVGVVLSASLEASTRPAARTPGSSHARSPLPAGDVSPEAVLPLAAGSTGSCSARWAGLRAASGQQSQM